MNYVMSDVHGQYEKYLAMLERIGFKDTDNLYVLGDVVDRGPQPVDLLQDMMARPNVFPIVGNHELMALVLLQDLSVEITAENFATHLDRETMEHLLQWQVDGGDSTLKQFCTLSHEERGYVLEYLSEFMPYELLKVGDRKFLLVHSGLGNFSPDKEMDEYTLAELTDMRPDFEKTYFDDPNFFIVCGHTPTQTLHKKAEIYKKNNNICIDCGAAFGGRLACLCLDTMEEYYVE